MMPVIIAATTISKYLGSGSIISKPYVKVVLWPYEDTTGLGDFVKEDYRGKAEDKDGWKLAASPPEIIILYQENLDEWAPYIGPDPALLKQECQVINFRTQPHKA